MTQNKFNIVVIDDNPADTIIAEMILKQIGFNTKAEKFSDPQLALQRIKVNEGKPNTIIFLDLHMPGMDGFEFIQEFEKLPELVQSNYTIILTTSSMDHDDINRGSSYDSVKYFVNKPLSKIKLLDIISSIES